jgi:uncharacterized coiled-coil protein SlyX
MTAVNLNLNNMNGIGDEGASALIDALKVNTSLTKINLNLKGLDESQVDRVVNDLLARNKRLRHLFLFDARQMLLSRLCSDECGVLWPYVLDGDDLDVTGAPDDVETVRAEFAAVVAERRRRELCRPVLVADVRTLQRETSNQIAVLNDIVSGQASQNAEQTNQIADLKNMVVEQGQQMQQMQDQIRQMHTLLMSRVEQEPSPDAVDERDKRAAKRRRTGR